MSETDIPLKTPSELLAEKIVSVLVDNKLVLAGDAKRMFRNLATGKLKPEDWQLMIEKAIDKENSNG